MSDGKRAERRLEHTDMLSRPERSTSPRQAGGTTPALSPALPVRVSDEGRRSALRGARAAVTPPGQRIDFAAWATEERHGTTTAYWDVGDGEQDDAPVQQMPAGHWPAISRHLVCPGDHACSVGCDALECRVRRDGTTASDECERRARRRGATSAMLCARTTSKGSRRRQLQDEVSGD